MSTHPIKTSRAYSAISGTRRTRAGLLAIAALVALLGAAVPAQAHSSTNSRPSISFNFSFGIGGTQSAPDRFRVDCMSNWTIKNWMRSQGYREVRFLGEWRLNKPKFSALWNGWRYTMIIDRCSGQASYVRRGERVNKWPQPPHSGFFFEWSLLNPNRH